MEKHSIYADHAATTSLSQTALEAMMPYLTNFFGNPSTAYSMGRKAKKAVEVSRGEIAQCLGAEAREIFFTSGGSEADNWALKGAAHVMRKQGKTHIITSRFEHHAVLHTCAALEKGMLLLYQYSPHTSQRTEKQKYWGVEQSSR